MAVEHKEIAFEDAIEASLLSTDDWTAGDKNDYDRELGLDPKQLFPFIEETQPDAWARLVKLQGGEEAARQRFLKRVATKIDEDGTIAVVRRGIHDLGVHIDLAYFKPAHGLTPKLLERYAKNRLTVTRQLEYAKPGTRDAGNTVDVTLFLNGIPVATAELKNPLTRQTVDDAIKQYRNDRDPKELLFAKRAVVHFAVDPDLVYLTTTLDGRRTKFLPFNRGSQDGGAGNPDNPRGYKTAYLFEQVWQRDAWLDILGRFIHRLATETVESDKKRTSYSWIF